MSDKTTLYETTRSACRCRRPTCSPSTKKQARATRAKLTAARLRDLAGAPFSHPGEPSPACRWGVGSDAGLPHLWTGSATLNSVPIVELFAQRVASKTASQGHLAHFTRGNLRLQRLSSADMHHRRQESVHDVVGLCLIFEAGRTIAAHSTLSPKSRLGRASETVEHRVGCQDVSLSCENENPQPRRQASTPAYRGAHTPPVNSAAPGPRAAAPGSPLWPPRQCVPCMPVALPAGPHVASWKWRDP